MARKKLREETYDTACGLHGLGLLDAERMREFDTSRLSALKPSGNTDINRLQLRAKTNQFALATYVNTSVSTVQKGKAATRSRAGQR